MGDASTAGGHGANKMSFSVGGDSKKRIADSEIKEKPAVTIVIKVGPRPCPSFITAYYVHTMFIPCS